MRLRLISIAAAMPWLATAQAGNDKLVLPSRSNSSPDSAMPMPPQLAPLHHVNTSTGLSVAYYEAGPSNGRPVILCHGFPFSIETYASVVPVLTQHNYRVIVPYLRGYGETRILNVTAARTAEQAALGSDLIALMDAMHIDKAIVGGYDWGSVAVNVAAALWPSRIIGMVATSSYLIQNRATAWDPSSADSEALMWYYYAFLTPRGAAGLASDPKGWARSIWRKNSVEKPIDEAYFGRTATAFNNPDYVDLAVNFYRNRLLYAPGAPEYAELAAKLDRQPPITVPSVTLDPADDLILPPKNASATASFFRNSRCHHIVRGAGHDIPHDAPLVFARAILEVDNLARVSNYTCPESL
ncbi:hypothetical protein NLG97_g2258 [Lecanicillium saksenae]|uniref:Uncharacterized protein n=1 Tax=Lecanicillium saksenae TaxID=468837 RepID=A0ACC1R3A7_9HYPO|nr:hypothetical protein NLG97_g2258 [Lecanicillium saksenae]